MSVARLCALFGVTRAGYCAWRQRPASPRVEQDRKLLAILESIFTRSGGTYGSPRLHRALAVQGHRISRRRVERLMRAGGLRARVVRVYRRSLKADLIHGERFRDIRELRRHLRRYVRYYNYCRMHSALQYRAPVDYERGAA